MPPESGLTPYSTPPVGASSPGNGAGRSGLASGKAAARAWVSIVRNMPRLSVASGRVVVQPVRCRHVAGCTSNSVDAAAAFTCAHAATSSGSLRACTVQYKPTLNSFAAPRANRSARSAASSAAASTYGSPSLPLT